MFEVDEKRTFDLQGHKRSTNELCVFEYIGMYLYINIHFILGKYKVFNMNLQLICSVTNEPLLFI